VIGGQNDRITAPAASRALAQALPDAIYVEMRRAAHAPFLSHRAEFVALVDNFLRGGEVHEGVARHAGVGTAQPTNDASHGRPSKKKRMKARARKKLQASSR